MMEKGKTKVHSVLNLYHQNSDDGKQVVDNSGREEVNVLEPMIFIEHQINEDTAIHGRFVFDLWTAASDTKLDSYTGASRNDVIKNQSRVAANLGVKKEIKKTNLGAELGFSSEYDYRSLNASFNGSRSFAKDNFTLGLNLQIFKEELSLFTDISNPVGAKIQEGFKRDIIAGSISASQILTRKDLFLFDFTTAHSSGYLESTASTVSVSGARKLESLPETRSRYAFTTKWVHGIGEASALNLSYRYYTDQWDLTAHTPRLAFLTELNENEDFLEFYVRYHQQGAAKYYKDSFTTSEAFMTSDSDLSKFNTTEIGLYWNQNLDDKELFGLTFERIQWNNAVTYSKRNTGLMAAYIQTGFGFEF